MINAQDNKTDLKIMALPVAERILKLREAGLIRNFTAVLRRLRVGKPLLIVTMVKLDRQTKTLLNKFEQTTGEMDEVQFCKHLAGRWDFMLYIIAESPQHYNDFFLERLCNLPNIAFIESSFVLKRSKSFSLFKFKL